MLNSPNFALYVAIIGFASSLLVVLINSAVTLASKRLDAKQKKEEHTLALTTLLYTRKLDAGEKEIGQYNLMVNTLSWLSRHYERLLEPSGISSEEHKAKEEYYNKIYEKNFESGFREDGKFESYFENFEGEIEANTLFYECGKAQNEVVSLTLAMKKLGDEYNENNTALSPLKFLATGNELKAKLRTAIEAYLILNKSARKGYLERIKAIRKQMEKLPI